MKIISVVSKECYFYGDRNKGQAKKYLKGGKMALDAIPLWSINIVDQPELHATYLKIISSEKEKTFTHWLLSLNDQELFQMALICHALLNQFSSICVKETLQ